jgi:hypothetical protein
VTYTHSSLAFSVNLILNGKGTRVLWFVLKLFPAVLRTNEGQGLLGITFKNPENIIISQGLHKHILPTKFHLMLFELEPETD